MMAMVHKQRFSLHGEIGWELLVMLMVEAAMIGIWKRVKMMKLPALQVISSFFECFIQHLCQAENLLQQEYLKTFLLPYCICSHEQSASRFWGPNPPHPYKPTLQR